MNTNPVSVTELALAWGRLKNVCPGDSLPELTDALLNIAVKLPADEWREIMLEPGPFALHLVLVASRRLSIEPETQDSPARPIYACDLCAEKFISTEFPGNASSTPKRQQ